MQGAFHRVASISGAMIVNSIAYAVPTPFLQGDGETIMHAADRPWHLHDLQAMWHSGQWLGALATIAFLHKLSYYVATVLSSQAADRWEHRRDRHGNPVQRFAHRTFTHSILMLILLFALCYIGYLYLKSITTLPGWLEQELWAIVGGVLVAFVVHIAIDMFSHQGVQVFAPFNNANVGLLPKRVRYTNEKHSESLVLWLFVFMTGVLFAVNVLGF
jgi:hypothetical protein